MSGIELPKTREDAIKVGASRYFTGVPCKNGHLEERNLRSACMACQRLEQQKWRDKPESKVKIDSYYQNNKTKLIAYASKFQKDNPERAVENLKRRRKEKPEYFKDRDRRWREDNQDQIEARRPLCMLERSTKKSTILKAESDLGYTKADLFKHITSLFEDGMSWGDRSKWHVDHILPVSLFIDNGITDVKMINALANLQPLWAADNIRKNNKFNK